MSKAYKNDVLIKGNRLEAYQATIPKSYLKTYAKAMSGKSRLCGVKAKCLDCVGFEDAPNRIRDCSVNICPLWPYRPYQTKKGLTND